MTITESNARRQRVAALTTKQIEEAAKEFFTQDELDEIDYQISTHQESIDSEIENYGAAEDPADDEPLSFYEAFRQMWDHAENVALCDLEEPKTRREARKAEFVQHPASVARALVESSYPGCKVYDQLTPAPKA